MNYGRREKKGEATITNWEVNFYNYRTNINKQFRRPFDGLARGPMKQSKRRRYGG